MGENLIFFKNLLKDTSPFCGAIDKPVLDFWWHLPWVSKPWWMFWTSDDICPGFQSHGGSLACFLACVILRFISGARLTDCIEVSMAAVPFQSTYLQIMCPQALVWVRSHDRPCHRQHLITGERFLSSFFPGNRKISIDWCHSYYLENVFLWECYVRKSTLIPVYFLSQASERSKLWTIEAQRVQERRQHYGPGFCIHRSTESTSKGQ